MTTKTATKKTTTTNATGPVSTSSTFEKKSKSGKRKRQRNKQVPKPGEEGFKTPTQLRNARKRRSKKKQKPERSPPAGQVGHVGNSPGGQHNIRWASSAGGKAGVDPSLLYLSDPTSAPVVAKAQRFFQGKKIPFKVHVGPTKGWRTVAKLAVRASGPNKDLSIGLFAPNSHDLIPVPDCVAHHPSINSSVAVLEHICRQHGVVPYDEKTGNGQLRHVAINVERSTGRVQVTLVWNGTKPNSTNQRDNGDNGDEQEEEEGDIASSGLVLDKLVQHLVAVGAAGNPSGGGGRKRRRGRQAKGDPSGLKDSSSPDNSGNTGPHKQHQGQDGLKLHSLWVHYNSLWKHANAVFNIEGGKDCWERRFGPTFVEERLEPLDRQEQTVGLRFPPNVFRQANLDAFTKIVASIRARLLENRNDRGGDNTKTRKQSCVELYGGVGTIGLNVADLFGSLVSSDENPFNKQCFDAAATASSGLHDVDVSYVSKNAADMVKAGALETANVAIMDPPRKGLDETTLQRLCKSKKPSLLVYVSCGFDAFERDCRTLTSSGWLLEQAEGHVLFPGSDAIETLAFFVRKP